MAYDQLNVITNKSSKFIKYNNKRKNIVNQFKLKEFKARDLHLIKNNDEELKLTQDQEIMEFPDPIISKIQNVWTINIKNEVNKNKKEEFNLNTELNVNSDLFQSEISMPKSMKPLKTKAEVCIQNFPRKLQIEVLNIFKNEKKHSNLMKMIENLNVIKIEKETKEVLIEKENLTPVNKIFNEIVQKNKSVGILEPKLPIIINDKLKNGNISLKEFSRLKDSLNKKTIYTNQLINKTLETKIVNLKNENIEKKNIPTLIMKDKNINIGTISFNKDFKSLEFLKVNDIYEYRYSKYNFKNKSKISRLKVKPL